ncbi:type I 3-dehydroquinate dehydratase [Periweissella beninensis]|uniref:type I 3-dehydroquinate dehydratase n=1 Tax=Periweissella beninensis TaxID=504936 RepID=UPI0021A61EBA|nr:type I 3-dehydroquinate dehydratase [Periweissella beninensis]MCT4396102.1 type I 3-dehydroquinate dehydratase [Periweissella beninensis]
MANVTIKNLTLATDKTSIAIPITKDTTSSILEYAQAIKTVNPDLVEWRIDFFEAVLNDTKLIKTSHDLRAILAPIPVLITFRTYGEGGNLPLDDTSYFKLLATIIDNNLADSIDIELTHDFATIKTLVTNTHAANIPVIMSNHDFVKTPSLTDGLSLLTAMDRLDADVLKIASMPNSTMDVLTVLQLSTMANQIFDKPIITISMGELGKLTRFSGPVFHSCLTFAALEDAPAPGQLDLDTLKTFLAELS